MIKKENIVVGFIGLTPLKKEALDMLMAELPSTSGTSRKRFVLDLETSTSPLLQKYRERIKQHKPGTRKNQKTQSSPG